MRRTAAILAVQLIMLCGGGVGCQKEPHPAPTPAHQTLSPGSMPPRDAATLPAADLTPTDIPERPDTSNLFPDGSGDRVLIDGDHHRVSRIGPGGQVRWATPLDGYLGNGREPHAAADAERAYVSHAGGMTALDAKTGAVVWHSAGPSDRILLSGKLLLATDCTSDRDENLAKNGRWLVARDTATGAEAFRVALPVKNYDPLPIAEMAGLFVVQSWESPDGTGETLLVDRSGVVFHRFNRQVITMTLSGQDRLVLTSHDVVRLGGNGRVQWSLPFQRREWIAGGQFTPLPDGDCVAYLFCHISDSGVQLIRFDPRTGMKKWAAFCRGLGVAHSAYQHDVVAVWRSGQVVVTSKGSGGEFVEALDANTGRSLGRRSTNDRGDESAD